ncbi:hypothetical protein A9267_16735 [Shewanella sp. UCD-FRSSP16_17]|uniref:hypothetical protein n=1 Tax=Shewanella sp. UCD-FRSSP16_17 TaxID=1853256 RepID=UPI0007EEBE9C|nr:hypothetical protein [Shewanella sp. UCD-FRSSP16_17]OBT05493.1 hypothetical protein A9267_16735 [Shewanella sp. UCD-FRSSP16_17]
MKRINDKIKLSEIMDTLGLDGSTSKQGIQLFRRLVDLINNEPTQDIFYLSINDAFFASSFGREGIVKVAKHFRKTKGLCLVDIEDEEVLENLISGVARLEQPIPYYVEDELNLVHANKIGTPSKSNAQVYEYTLKRELTNAHDISEAFELKINNASNKLKILFEEGFLLRKEDKSSSGGIEYFYYPIK